MGDDKPPIPTEEPPEPSRPQAIPVAAIKIDTRDIYERTEKISMLLDTNKVPNTSVTVHAIALLLADLIRRGGGDKHTARRVVGNMFDLAEKNAIELGREEARGQTPAPPPPEES